MYTKDYLYKEKGMDKMDSVSCNDGFKQEKNPKSSRGK